MKKNEIRQEKVFAHLVEEYIESAEPVSSKLICQKYVSNASPATIRIDLNKLEKCNWIYQPYTSAGRIPTIQGYREYLKIISPQLAKLKYDKQDLLRNILIKFYKDIPMAMHYIMQLLAKETEQLSFVAEPEVSYGYLEKLDAFKISEDKLLFVVSLDSGLDKTVILKSERGFTEQQLKIIVKYVNDELVGERIYDIQNRFLEEIAEKITDDNKILKLFLDELQNAFTQISSYFIHFDGSISFLEQPEFDDKKAILNFLGFIQQQDYFVNLMRKFEKNDNMAYHVLLGEDLGKQELSDYALIYSKYEIFGIPGYLGVIGPVRMDYKRYIPIIRDVSEVITKTTKKGMVVLKNE